MKSEITSCKMLTHFDPNKETEVYTDGSPVGISAILMQEGKPVKYVSRLLTPGERRYCQTEKEALAIVWACEKLHTYLYGLEFVLNTDHKPLVTLYGRSGNPSARVLRWALRMQPYCYRVKYMPGKTNPADYMSRHPPPNRVEASGSEDGYINAVIANAIPRGVSLQEIVMESAKDPEIQNVIEVLKDNKWGKFNGPKGFCSNKK